MLTLIPLMFLSILPPWAQWMDMGRVADNDDFTGMLGRGLILTYLCGWFLYFFGYGVALVISGPAMALIYYGCWRLYPSKLKPNSFIDGPTSVAELLVGFWLFSVTTAMLLV